MNNEQAEISIRFSDLCAAFLKKIKPIVLFVLVFTLLGALFGAFRTIRGSASVSEEALLEAETAVVDAKNSVSEAEGALKKLLEIDIPQAEAAVDRAGLLAQRRQDYMDDSLYYALDPFHLGVSRVTLYVETQAQVDPETPWLSADPQSSIANAFAKLYPLDSEVLENARKIMKTDAELPYISELVSITASDDEFVEICVYHEDPATAKAVTDYLLETLPVRLTDTFDDFTVHVISQFCGYEISWKMNDRHIEAEDNLTLAQTDLFTAEQDLQTLKENTQASAEQLIEDNRSAAEEAEAKLLTLQERAASARPTTKNIVKKAVIFAFVFCVLGVFASCVLVFLGKLFGGKLQDINDVLTRCSFPLIGTLPAQKKRLFEKTIRKLEGEPDLDYEAAGKATAQSLFSVVGDRRIALVSSEGPETVQELLPFTGERIPVCGDLLRDAEAVKAARDYEGFVLVEKRGKSRFDLVAAEVRRIRSLGKQVEGIILL